MCLTFAHFNVRNPWSYPPFQDSKVNLNRFKQEFRMAVAPFLQPATTEASSTISASRRRR